MEPTRDVHESWSPGIRSGPGHDSSCELRRCQHGASPPGASAVPLRVALLTPGPAVPGWLGEALAEAERRGEVVVAATIDAGPTSWGASRIVEETCNRLQALLEGRAAASEARQLFPAAASARMPSPPRPDVDLLLDCSGAAAAPQIGRLGTLRCEFCGERGELGLYRAMVEGFRAFEVAYGPAGMLLRKALQRIAAGAPAPAEPGTPARAAAPVGAVALGRYAFGRALRSIDGRWRSAQPARFWLEEMQNWFLAYRTDRSRFVRNTAHACMDGFELLLPPPDSYTPIRANLWRRDHAERGARAHAGALPRARGGKAAARLAPRQPRAAHAGPGRAARGDRRAHARARRPALSAAGYGGGSPPSPADCSRRAPPSIARSSMISASCEVAPSSSLARRDQIFILRSPGRRRHRSASRIPGWRRTRGAGLPATSPPRRAGPPRMPARLDRCRAS